MKILVIGHEGQLVRGHVKAAAAQSVEIDRPEIILPVVRSGSAQLLTLAVYAMRSAMEMDRTHISLGVDG